MSVMLTVLLVVQILSALTIIVLVLLQQGKGADMGSAFGGGSAGSLFGATGAANFLSRTTKWAAVVFFVSTAGLAYVGRPVAAGVEGGGVMENHQPTDTSIPTIPGTVAPQTSKDSSVPSAPAAAVPAVPVPAPVPAPAPVVPVAPAAPAK
jgi:preprotein translocase subunit SecG